MKATLTGLIIVLTASTLEAYRVSVWAVPDDPRSLESIERYAGVVHEVNPVWFKTQSDGTLRHDDAAKDPRWLAAMAGADIVPVVRPNKHDAENAEIIGRILTSRSRVEKHTSEIISLFDKYTFIDGVEIDYERLDPSTRDAFTRFIEELARRAHARGKTVSVDVEALTWNDDTEDVAQDWKRIGAAADRVKIMAYDYHHSTSGPGPVTPLGWLDDVAAYAVDTIPRHKIIFGLPWYGYHWKDGDEEAATVFYEDAIELAEDEDRVPHRERNGELTFKFRSHTVYFQDAESYARKASVLKPFAIAGFAHWRAGGESADMWKTVDALRLEKRAKSWRAFRSAAAATQPWWLWPAALSAGAVIAAVATRKREHATYTHGGVE